MTLDATAFYRLLANISIADAQELRARQAYQEAQRFRADAMRAAGLDPSKSYRLDEATLQAIELEAPAADAGAAPRDRVRPIRSVPKRSRV